MANDFSFLVLNSSKASFRHTHISRWTFYGIIGGLLFFMLITAASVIGYVRIWRKDLDKERLQSELAIKSQELVHYQKQIQKFASEINQLKNNMVAINQMNKQIRRVAEMDENAVFFGIGGSVPEGLDSDIELERRNRQLIIDMHQYIDELQDAVVWQKKSLHDLWTIVEQRGNIMTYTPMIQPAEGLITSSFGFRKSPFTGKREFHEGLDIANSMNTEIMATGGGRICFVGKRPGLGQIILIDHGHGLKTLYAHLEKILKRKGDVVMRGEVIGLMGSTGRSTGPHLHYEVRLNAIPMNPERYIFDRNFAANETAISSGSNH